MTFHIQKVAFFATFSIWNSYFRFSLFSIISLFFIFTNAYSTNLEHDQVIFTENVCKLIEHIDSLGFKVTLGEAFRTHAQAVIYAHSGLGIVNSLHCQRLAIDLNIFSPQDKLLATIDTCEQFGAYWESLNPRNVWGGYWLHRPDTDHYEMVPK